MTPLYQRLQEMIALEGPISVERFMALCLSDPVHGYYMTRDPLGAAGDFTTAPEISQIFGELLGLWAVSLWNDMGAPPLRLVELGPGRGTLMADALRAARIVPKFGENLHVHMVETSPVLRAAQQAMLTDSVAPVQWHDSFDDVPPGPLIVLANEFFDALPIRQFFSHGARWYERLIGENEEGRLSFGLNTEPVEGMMVSARDGDILEVNFAAIKVMEQLARRVATYGGGALIIDYGHSSTGFGDTLQAVHRHRFADLITSAGEADLTAHVDFAALLRVARAAGTSIYGPMTQATLLDRLGANERGARLLRAATTEDQQKDLRKGLQRLIGTGPQDMGVLFKAVALTAPKVPAPAGFEIPDPLMKDLP